MSASPLPVFLAFLITILFIPLLPAQPVVRTQAGRVSGEQVGAVRIFRGVPFAAPPVGELRWRPPQPVGKWKGVRKCVDFPPSAMQADPVPFLMWTEEFITPPAPLSEDCLYLNVWTAAKKAGDNRPVFVWIHGGGFTGGSGACAVYDGEAMAKKGVVYVTINYRLGVFGFLAHAGLSRESEHYTSGNYALLDQIAALRWVRDNIAAFGGDPGNVTIAGQSAGSISVNALMASPLARGLFHRAIAQSGGILGGRFSRGLAEAERSGGDFLEKAGVASIAELRRLPAGRVQTLAEGVPFGAFAPILDGHVLPRDLAAAFRSGTFNDVPFLSGWVAGDGALMGPAQVTADAFRRQAFDTYGDRAEAFLRIFPAPDDAGAAASRSRLNLIQFAALSPHLVAGYGRSQAWLYEFNHVPPDKPGFPNYGAFHTSEVPYALNALSRWDRPWQPYDHELADRMSDYWVNFARNGDPNGPGLPEWAPYDQATGAIMVFGDYIEQRPGLMKAELDFLDDGIRQ